MASQFLDENPAAPTLLIHPQRAGYLLIAWRGSSISYVEVAAPSDREPNEALAARLADAAAPLFHGAARVHLQVHRSLIGLPLDRLLAQRLARVTTSPPRAPPLVAFTVSAIAAPSSSIEAAQRCSGAPRALLVSNPQQNLWAASQSAPVVRAQLERRGLVVDELQGASVTRAALLARLADPCVQLLHYDGHARATLAEAAVSSAASAAAAPASAGVASTPAPASASSSPAASSVPTASAPRRAVRDRLDDALLLAGGDTLTAAHILALPRVPPAVVLNGCTTAAPEGLGLAQAFLAAGAHQVIAALDEIDAAAAARFTTLLFEDTPSSSAALDLVSLFWRAISVGDLPSLRAYER